MTNPLPGGVKPKYLRKWFKMASKSKMAAVCQQILHIDYLTVTLQNQLYPSMKNRSETKMKRIFQNGAQIQHGCHCFEEIAILILH